MSNCCITFNIRAQSHTSACSFALNISALHLNTSKTPCGFLLEYFYFEIHYSIFIVVRVGHCCLNRNFPIFFKLRNRTRLRSNHYRFSNNLRISYVRFGMVFRAQRREVFTHIRHRVQVSFNNLFGLQCHNTAVGRTWILFQTRRHKYSNSCTDLLGHTATDTFHILPLVA